VLLETGLAGGGADWALVQTPLRDHASLRVRPASLGASPPTGEASRTSSDFVDDITMTLAAAGVDAPYVLVGHSTGAWQVIVFASTYPDEVAGAVYVDPRNPGTSDAFLESLGKVTPGEPAAATSLRG